MKIIDTDPFHSQIGEFEELCKLEWPDDFESDFNGSAIRCLPHPQEAKILLLQNREYQIVGGLILTLQDVLNQYTDNAKEERVLELIKNGYRNLSYLVIKADQRNNGLGTQLLHHLAESEYKCWLKAEPTRVNFYTSRGFGVDCAETLTDANSILVSNW